MKNVRLRLEEKVLGWPSVSRKKMFGCPCYQANGKLFAFWVTNGLIITQLELSDKEKLSKKFRVSPFTTGNRVVQKWTKVQIGSVRDLDQVVPFVRKSYQSAVKKDVVRRRRQSPD